MLLQRSDFTWLAKQNTVCWTHEGKWAKMYFTYRCRQANSWQELEKDWRAVGKNYHHQRWTVRVYGAVLYSLDTLYIAIASVSVLSLPSLYEEHTAQLQMHASHYCLDAASLSFCLLPTMQQQLHSGHCFIARCTSLHEMCAPCTAEVCQPVCRLPRDQSTTGLKLVIKGDQAYINSLLVISLLILLPYTDPGWPCQTDYSEE